MPHCKKANALRKGHHRVATGRFAKTEAAELTFGVFAPVDTFNGGPKAMMRACVVALTLSSLLTGQQSQPPAQTSTQPCPVQVLDAHATFRGHTVTDFIHIKYKNNGSKTIKAVSFSVQMIDAVNESVDYPGKLIMTGKVKPEKEGKASFSIHFPNFAVLAQNGVKAAAAKVVFDDDSEMFCK